MPTLRRWLDDPIFQAALAKRKERRSEQARDELLIGALAAVRTLVRELNNTSATTRLRAAQLILDFGLTAEADAAIERRMNDLEGT